MGVSWSRSEWERYETLLGTTKEGLRKVLKRPGALEDVLTFAKKQALLKESLAPLGKNNPLKLKFDYDAHVNVALRTLPHVTHQEFYVGQFKWTVLNHKKNEKFSKQDMSVHLKAIRDSLWSDPDFYFLEEMNACRHWIYKKEWLMTDEQHHSSLVFRIFNPKKEEEFFMKNPEWALIKKSLQEQADLELCVQGSGATAEKNKPKL